MSASTDFECAASGVIANECWKLQISFNAEDIGSILLTAYEILSRWWCRSAPKTIKPSIGALSKKAYVCDYFYHNSKSKRKFSESGVVDGISKTMKTGNEFSKKADLRLNNIKGKFRKEKYTKLKERKGGERF